MLAECHSGLHCGAYAWKLGIMTEGSAVQCAFQCLHTILKVKLLCTLK